MHILIYTSIFLSSLLLFVIQPLLGKHMLPLFGGASNVWTASMLFFQTLLLFGYYYSYKISTLKPKAQAIIHIILLLLNLIFILYRLRQPGTLLLPLSFPLSQSHSPVSQILAFLALSICLPYLLLSTTSTLLSKWHYRLFPLRSPYPLYALSNLGSLLAIIAFPLFLEPLFSTQALASSWMLFFFLLCFLLTGCSLGFFYSRRKILPLRSKSSSKDSKVALPSKPSKITQAAWLTISALSSLLLLSTTNILTQSVAPVPFLWLMPLGLYLFTFSISFQGLRLPLNPTLFAILSIILAPFCFLSTIILIPSMILIFFLFAAFLLCSFMVCHLGLFRLKPHPLHLERFYLLIALGGVLGSSVVAIVAPILFNDLWEFQMSLLLIIAMSLFAINKYKVFSFTQLHKSKPSHGISTKLSTMAILIALTSSAALSLIFINLYSKKLQSGQTIVSIRNFYGAISVQEFETKEGKIRFLQHGKITHGTQFVDSKKQQLATSYYIPNSGFGIAFDRHRMTHKKPLRIGVTGLGVGTIAAYAKKGDTIRFFEINPDVEKLARMHFTYLKNAQANTDVVIGDGRVELTKEIIENNLRYDIVVLDAFSDDSIPMHLLNLDAFRVYIKRLNTDGTLIVNISNSYLDLRPVIKKLADRLSLSYAIIRDDGRSTSAGAPSEWAILTRNEDLFNTNEFLSRKVDNSTIKDIPIWTDNYSNLLHVLR